MEKELQRAWKTLNTITDKYRRYAGRWHLESCNFPNEDMAVCNCNKTEIKKNIEKLLIHGLLSPEKLN